MRIGPMWSGHWDCCLKVNNMRKYTSKLIEGCEAGSLLWEDVARACLTVMSEADVQDMAESEGLIEVEEEEKDDEEQDEAEDEDEE